MGATCRIERVDFARAQTSIVMIRTRVFQEEQGIAPALEFDGCDAAAEHLLAYQDGNPVGTARLRGLDRATIKFERLAVLPVARGCGVGTQLMQVAIARARTLGYDWAIVHAQAYISTLYERLGFTQSGDHFEEAGIPHIRMELMLEDPKQ